MKKRIFKTGSLVIILLILVSSFSVCFSSTFSADSLPDFVDNSQSEYFPAIDNQADLGACISWGQTYYQFTYMMNRSMGVKTTPENTFSPSFNFNIINGGRGTGAWDKDGYNIMKEIGSVPLSTVPYNTTEWNNWFATEEVWKEAMQYRIKGYTYLKDIGMDNSAVTSPDDSDLLAIKTLLSQGEVLAVTTPIYSWDVERIKANPNVPENDKYVDEYVVRLCDKSGQGHRLALVGYNDNIWTDVNDNNKVDSGEMGAFKVANSWGTERHNKGFMWIAYDALNMTSCVAGCPVSGNYRPEALHDFVSIEVLPYDSDTDLYLRYTLNTADRSQGKVFATATHADGTEYTLEIGPKRMHGMTFNKYSYDGTTNANDGTMVFALSNIVPEITPETLHEYSWSFKFEDTTADGKAFTVRNLEIVDTSTGRISKPNDTYPIRIDGSTKIVNFPQIKEYIPVTTAVPTTETPAISEVITTATVTTTVAPITTQNNTTEPSGVMTSASASSVASEPAETTVVVSDSTDPAETTITTDPAEVVTSSVVNNTTEPDIPSESTATSVTGTAQPTNTTVEATTVTIESTTATAIFDEYIYGDANNDGAVKIGDATIIQKYIAHLVGDDKLNLKSADCNEDAKVSVKDATCIQKYLAKLSGCGLAGQVYTVEVSEPTIASKPAELITTVPQTLSSVVFTTEIITDSAESTTTPTTVLADPIETTTLPVTTTEAISTSLNTTSTTTVLVTTEATTVATTAEPTTVEITTTVAPTTVTEPLPVISNLVTFTNSFGWQGTISCYYWSDADQTMTSWPGKPMQNAGTNDFGETIYTFEVPKDATYIIFTNGSLQTIDISYPGGELKFYPVAPNNEGKYTVENW